MADVLKPKILQLGNFHYRINPGDANRREPESHSSYEDHQEAIDYETANDGADIDSRVTKTDNGNFSASLTIPSSLYRFVIGKKGDTKRRLEYETKCTVTIPGRGTEGNIVIKGRSGRAVTSAISRIEMLVESGRKKLDFTHFISVPLNQPIVLQGFQEFQEDVMSNFSKSHGVDTSLFQVPSKLHLTIGTLTLLNDSEITRATELLHGCAEALSQTLGKNYRLRVQNLDYMNDDPTCVDVLYAKVKSADGTDRIQTAVDQLCSRLLEGGILNRDFERDRVKLHLTLMNTTFRKDKTNTGHTKHRQTFDAKQILEVMGKFDFGEVDFPGFYLSKRYSTSCTGYYETITSILTSSEP